MISEGDSGTKLTRQQRRLLGRQQQKAIPTASEQMMSVIPDSINGHIKLIDQEIDRLGISRDANEELLWKNGFATISLNRLPINQQATYKMNDTFLRMGESNNPVLTQAFETYSRLIDTGISSKPIPIIHDQLMMGTSAVPSANGSIQFDLEFNAPATADHAHHPFPLAALLVHEITHLEDMAKFDKTLPESLSQQERLRAHWDRHASHIIYRRMEMNANAELAKALLYHIGMTGVNEFTEENLELVSVYISSNHGENTELWEEYHKNLAQRGLVSKNNSAR